MDLEFLLSTEYSWVLKKQYLSKYKYQYEYTMPVSEWFAVSFNISKLQKTYFEGMKTTKTSLNYCNDLSFWTEMSE